MYIRRFKDFKRSVKITHTQNIINSSCLIMNHHRYMVHEISLKLKPGVKLSRVLKKATLIIPGLRVVIMSNDIKHLNVTRYTDKNTQK